MIRPPAPPVAFGGQRIAWALTKKRLLMEFLDRQRTPLDVSHKDVRRLTLYQIYPPGQLKLKLRPS